MKNKHDRKHVIYEGKFLRLYNKDGWEFVERTNCTSIVAIIGITDEKEVLLVEQYRMPVGKYVIEFPAGLVNDRKGYKHESMVTAARRELIEETGYRARSMKKIFSGPLSSGLTSEIMTFYFASGLEKVGVGGGDHTEKINVHKVKLNKLNQWAKKMQARGKIVDPKVFAGIYFTSHLRARY